MAIQVVRLQAVTTGLPVAGASSGRSPRPACTIIANGTWGAGSLKPQIGFQSTTGAMVWADVTGVTALTANGMVSFEHRFENLRLVFSGATGPDLQVAVMT